MHALSQLSAIQRQTWELVDLLKSRTVKTDADRFPNNTNVVLAAAAYLGNIALVKKLLEEGEAGETLDPLLDDPRISTARGGHYDMLKLFLDQRIERNPRCFVLRSCLLQLAKEQEHHSCRGGHLLTRGVKASLKPHFILHGRSRIRESRLTRSSWGLFKPRTACD